MNTPDTPASAAYREVLRQRAKARIDQILTDADALDAVAEFLRDSNIRGRTGMAEVIERSAANLRQLVE
jgi:hypothetical protein